MLSQRGHRYLGYPTGYSRVDCTFQLSNEQLQSALFSLRLDSRQLFLAQSWLAIWMDIELLRPTADFGHLNRTVRTIPRLDCLTVTHGIPKKSTAKSFFQPRASQLLSHRYCFRPMAIFVLRLGSTASTGNRTGRGNAGF